MTGGRDAREARARGLLWLDGGAGLAVGATMLLLRDWLADLYRMPLALVVVIGAANLAYGCYSGSLAVRASRGDWPSRRAIDVLVAANIAWSVVCVVMLLALHASVGLLGLGHVALEGGFVAGLARAERRHVRPLVR